MNDTDRGLGKPDARERASRALTRRWRGWHTQPHVSQTQQKRGQLTDGCTDAPTHIQQTTHKPSDTPQNSPDVGPTQGHTRARTQVRLRATRTPRTGTRAWPSAAGWEKVAALTRRVYLLICINERLYPIPPASGGRGCRICSRRGTLTGTSIGGSSDAAGAEGTTNLEGREEGLQVLAARDTDQDRGISGSCRVRDIWGWQGDFGI